ncbi:MAG: 16S rRNA (cytosine(1402)-N(4))-methyltransferase RsmH [bacterium]|nr:16S rRNA (cytosine(1402)-N(4))-methyltransferase RsmH [bacterium]
MLHTPVLLNEVLEYLDPKPGDKIIDATFGFGGHSLAMAGKVGTGGRILGIEATEELYKKAVESKKDNLILINDNFINLEKIAQENDFNNANGILFDLGISSWHFEGSGKGFSFQKDEPLNMNISSYLEIPNHNLQNTNKTAEGIVNEYSAEDLTRIFKEYGEERFAGPIAEAIIRSRKNKTIKTTFELVEIIRNTVPGWYQHRRIHFATKIFQALRVETNNELENLKSALKQSEQVLKKGGRLAVISFHSLEDRIVKNFLRDGKKDGKWEILTKKPIVPGREEIINNPRSRSAKLRVAELI